MAILVKGNNGGLMNRFEPGESGNPKGRPRKLATKLAHEGYSQSQVKMTIDKMSAMTRPELKKWVKGKDITVLELGVAKMIEDFIDNNKTDLLEYLISKKQTSEVKSTVEIKRDFEENDLQSELEKRGLPKVYLKKDE